MTNSKHTKRALLASVLSVVMCVAMLVGTTFAWFTDSVTSGNNKIMAGNLDIELYHSNGAVQDEKVEEDTLLFTDVKLWEPGAVVYEKFTVKNEGTLALKYKLAVNVANATATADGKTLADVLKVTVVENGFDGERVDATAYDFKPLETFFDEGNLVEDAEKTFGVIIYWEPTANDNDYNVEDELSIDIGIDLQATQDTVESDSFGNDYDKNAVYPDIAYAQLSTQEELNSILKNPTDSNGKPTKEVVVELGSGEYTLPAITGDKKVTIFGGDNTVIDMTNTDGIIGAQNDGLDLTIEGAMVNFSNKDYRGITHSKKVTYKDCTITGKQFLYAEEVEFVNCKFVQNTVDYNVWTYGAGKVLFNQCEFSCKGKSVLIYNEGAINEQTVEFQNCKFHASQPSLYKAAIEIDSTGTSYNIIIDQATADNVTGFSNGSVSKNPVWNVKNHIKPVTVTVAGSVVYPV